MAFSASVNEELLIGGVSYRIAEHPQAPGMPYGQEGRQATVYQVVSDDGHLYGVPHCMEAIALFYNKDLVPTPPATRNELKATARKLQDEGEVDQGFLLQ